MSQDKDKPAFDMEQDASVKEDQFDEGLEGNELEQNKTAYDMEQDASIKEEQFDEGLEGNELEQDASKKEKQFGEWLKDNEFFQKDLPGLAKHFDRKELNALENKHEWLACFKVSQPDISKARDKFLHRGSDLCAALEQHCTLLRLATGSDGLVYWHGSDYIRYINILKDQNERQRKLIDHLNPPFTVTVGLREYERLQLKEKSSSLRAMWGAAIEAIKRYQEDDNEIVKMASECRDAWVILELKRKGRGIQRPFESPFEEIKGELDFFKNMQRVFNDALHLSSAWNLYRRNVKDFTYRAGCPNAHEDPTKNIAELRQLHATQMPFFHQLQEDLAEKTRQSDRQQRIITCLVFRHLFEHLPDRKGHNATFAWKLFWKNAFIKASHKETKEHPLKHLLDERAEDVATKLTEATNIQKQPSNWAQGSGTVYEIGNGLYSITSANIHGYKGDPDRATTKDGDENKTAAIFNVRDDQWPEPLNDILKALRPIYFHEKCHELEGEVDWEAERKRYLSTDTSAEYRGNLRRCNSDSTLLAVGATQMVDYLPSQPAKHITPTADESDRQGTRYKQTNKGKGEQAGRRGNKVPRARGGKQADGEMMGTT